MDGLFHGKPYEQMDGLVVFPYFWKHQYLGERKKEGVGLGSLNLKM